MDEWDRVGSDHRSAGRRLNWRRIDDDDDDDPCGQAIETSPSGWDPELAS
jgi:hypothetical protein